jgi:hypothetical protein
MQVEFNDDAGLSILLEFMRYMSNKFYMVLTMVYNPRDYWVFGLCP